ncbi:uncharacterized protein [Rutidosis leptorrhynchoides]|uniref:uncharacterized protein n=1 Tax=Rutidosis leptorrhynchoides TaxID=125765 RepID=UPI003A98FA60
MLLFSNRITLYYVSSACTVVPDGSVTTDLSTTIVKDAKKNIKFKKDKSAIVHVGLGMVSFTKEALCEKPAGLKKSSKYDGYVTTFHICSTTDLSYPVSI